MPQDRILAAASPHVGGEDSRFATAALGCGTSRRGNASINYGFFAAVGARSAAGGNAGHGA